MSKILVIYHSQSGNTKAAAELVAKGAQSVEGADVKIKQALKTTSDDLLNCDAIAVGSPDYFGYMAGGLKDFFDRTYYPTQGQVTDKPCAIFVTHGGKRIAHCGFRNPASEARNRRREIPNPECLCAFAPLRCILRNSL